MIVFSLILFAAAIALAVFAILISKGNVNVINCYHEDRVSDKLLYCKKMSQALWVMAAVMIVSGIIGLLGDTEKIALCAVGVLVIGTIGAVCNLFHVQKKYGGGVF